MSKSLNEALDNVDMTYDQLIDISDNMIKPITEELDKIIKNGIRQLIADYPDRYYFKSYLGSIL